MAEKKKGTQTFTAEERAAMRETARERKSPGGEPEVLAKIAEMPKADRVIAERVHAIVTANAPQLTPRTWYGMPAYALDGKVLCFFQSAAKFKSRYASFGFSDTANLDQGEMWPTYFAIRSLGPAEEKKLAALVKKAVKRAAG